MLFTKGNLLNKYSWIHTKEDDPKLKGEPDHILLNRDEGYEVLYMINQLMSAWKLKQVITGQKIEKMIKENPSNLRSQQHVKLWIKENWNKY